MRLSNISLTQTLSYRSSAFCYINSVLILILLIALSSISDTSHHSHLPTSKILSHFYQWLDTLPIIFLLSSFSIIKNKMSSSALMNLMTPKLFHTYNPQISISSIPVALRIRSAIYLIRAFAKFLNTKESSIQLSSMSLHSYTIIFILCMISTFSSLLPNHQVP